MSLHLPLMEYCEKEDVARALRKGYPTPRPKVKFHEKNKKKKKNQYLNSHQALIFLAGFRKNNSV